MSDLRAMLPDPPQEAECFNCNGDGWYQETESGHGCDGTDEVCAVTCPIPVAVQVQCETCGGTGVLT